MMLFVQAQNVGIGPEPFDPTHRLQVDGKIRIGDDTLVASPGVMRFNTTTQTFEGYDGTAWGDLNGYWSETGGKVYYSDGPVLVGRTSTIGAERFGVRYPVSGASYGGMYMETFGNASSKPFYGYAIDNSFKMWHYYDGGTGTWRLYNNGERLIVKNTGEVGIGVVDPESHLHVAGGVWDLSTSEGDLKVGNSAYRLTMGVATSGGGAGDCRIFAKGGSAKLILGSNTSDILSLLPNGRVGIGTIVPDVPLHVYDATVGFSVKFESDAGGTSLVLDNGAGTSANSTITFQEGGSFKGSLGYDVDDEYLFMYESGNALIAQDGRVGIGTIPDVNYRLSVDGKVIAEELKIEMSQNWPDYVFDKEYPLPSLEQVEQHIAQHSHLPGVPSSSEIQEAGGFQVGEMNRVLLQKVEELTLYIIEQDKRIRALEARVVSQNSQAK